MSYQCPAGDDWLYGCNSKIRPELESHYLVQDGRHLFVGTSRPILRWYKDPLSRECKYDRSAEDRHCAGCAEK